MDFPTSHLTTHSLYNLEPLYDEHHHQILEIRRCFVNCLMFGSPHQVVNQTSQIAFDVSIFSLPLFLLHDEPTAFPAYVAQLLDTRNIDFNASEILSLYITMLVHHITSGDSNARFRIVVLANYFQFTWMDQLSSSIQEPVRNEGMMEPSSFPVEQSTKNEVMMEKLEEIGKDLGDCSICLDEFCSNNNREVVRIPCGHVYHETCILQWLSNGHSCPLCRRPILPLEG